MNISKIQMEPAEARRRLTAYRKSLHRKTDAEYERIALAYEQLEKGTALIILSRAIQGAPVDHKGRPRLAIARADRHQVEVSFEGSMNTDRFLTFDASNPARRLVGASDLRFVVQLNRPTEKGWPESRWNRQGFALVPIVPADVRERRDLREHFVLWEVEQWADSRITSQPDRDPYLLRKVSDDLFAVVGEWELTEIERAVTADRING